MRNVFKAQPQHGGEVIVAICGLPELYIYIRDGWYQWASGAKPSLSFTINMRTLLN
jgi:hypothetical protein